VRLTPALASVFFGCGAIGCGVANHSAASATGPLAHPVLVSAASEEGPAAAGGWLAWMQSAGVNPLPPHSRTDVFVRRDRRSYRVNPPGTHALTGGIDGRRLVVQITEGGKSRIARFDLLTHALSYLPSFVNDGAWLWRPDLDGHRILYGAIVPGRSQIVAYEIRLADLDSGHVRILLRLDGHADYAAPGQLRGNWATWVSCPDNVCNVWRENLASGHAESAPDPEYVAHSQFGPAVDPHGVVYFGRSRSSCGDTQIRRWDGRRTTLVIRLPARYAFQYAYLDKTAPRLYFDLTGCNRTARSDIYAIGVHH